MFTGLVQDIGTVQAIDDRGDWRIRIATALNLAPLAIGASIACAGICLTLIDKGTGWFDVQVSKETRDRTSITNWREGTRINLEPSLKLGQELGGHFVFGHVDGLATITNVGQAGNSHMLTLETAPEFQVLIAPKGSVSLDGVSLTVNKVSENSFMVNIIPHTWEKTTLGTCRAGDRLHLEIDMLARYVARMLAKEAA